MAARTGIADMRRELDRLRLRLHEAEQALDALRNGTVDAVVVAGPGGSAAVQLPCAEPGPVTACEGRQGIVILSLRGDIVHCNSAFASSLGANPGELLGQSFERLVAPEDRQAVRDMVALGPVDCVRANLRLLAPPGSPRLLHVSACRLNGSSVDGICLACAPVAGEMPQDSPLTSDRLGQAIFENTAEAVVVCDNRGRIVCASRAAQRLCGHNPVFTPFGHAFPLRFASGLVELYEDWEARDGSVGPGYPISPALRGKTLTDIDAVLLCPDGAFRDMLVSAGPVWDVGAGVLGCVVTLTDISERRRESEMLRRQAATLQQQASLIELAHDAIIIRGLDNRITFWNRGAEELYGWTDQEALGRPIHAMLRTRFPMPAQDIERALLTDGSWEGELLQRRSTGEPVAVRSRWALRRDEKGHPIAILEINRDETQRRQARSALRANAERFRVGLKHAPIGVFNQDTALRFTWAYNPLMGVEPEDLIGRCESDLLAADDFERIRTIKQHVLDTGVGTRVETPVTMGERSGWWDLTIEPLHDEAGAVVGITCAAVDITARKETEAHVQALNDRLHQSVIETHHRVKNNLQIMAAMVDMRLMEGPEVISREELRRLSASVRALSTVHDILTAEARTDPRSEQVPASKVVERLIELLAQSAEGRVVDADVQEVRLNSRKCTSLALVVNELVINAVKHGRDRICLRLAAEGETAVLTIGDDGPGFPQDFDAERDGNTGIELITNLVDWDLGGTVVFANGDGGGAEVRVEFPIG